VFYIAGVLAFALPLLEIWRPFSLPDVLIAALASGSLLASAGFWLRSPSGTELLLTVLPAVPLAYAVELLEGGPLGARLLAATAFAIQARILFAAAAARGKRERERLVGGLNCHLPEQTTVFVDNDIESEVRGSALREGHVFQLSPGQVAPADGLVTFGSSFVDERLTPDSPETLRIKGMGSRVLAGTRNRNGTLLVRATAVGGNTFTSKLAERIRHGSEFRRSRLLALDLALTAAPASCLLLMSGPQEAFRIFLLSSSAGCLALLGAFETALAQASIACRCLWRSRGGVRSWNAAGMVVLQPEGVLSEGRPKLAAVECVGNFTEDAALALIAPLARKLETPAAFAILQELRVRNIPLQLTEIFQATEGGGLAFVAGEEIRWVPLEGAEVPAAFQAFVGQARAVGDEVVLLERQGIVQAAFSFRDAPVAGAAAAVSALRELSLPVLLASALPKTAVARLQTELELDHVQGEARMAEIETLMDRLTEEKLAPAWVRTGAFLPRSRAAVAALSSLEGEAADLLLPQLDLPSLAQALTMPRTGFRRLRYSLVWVFGAQGFQLALLLTGAIHSEYSLALAGVLPGALALLLVPFGARSSAGDTVGGKNIPA
jgi:Cu+-exporting ATPase